MGENEIWNAHGEISVRLESKAHSLLQRGMKGAYGTIFNADSIDQWSFAEAMIALLRWKYGYDDNIAIEEFSKSLAPVWGKVLSEIGRDTTCDLFKKFLELYK